MSNAGASPVALIPAAGFGRRMGVLPCSKELLPVGWSGVDEVSTERPLAGYLLERLAAGGVRSALMLICVEGLSYKEAAEVLQVPMGTVTSRLVRARKSLLEKLGGETVDLDIGASG